MFAHGIALPATPLHRGEGSEIPAVGIKAAAGGLEGPFLSVRRCGAHEPRLLIDPAREHIDGLLAAGDGHVSMVTLAPERTGGLEAIRRIVEAGAVAAIGHTDANHQLTVAAIGAGARVATHLFNGMPPLHHRDPGPVLALLDDQRVVVELVVDGAHLDPALVRHVVGSVGFERAALAGGGRQRRPQAWLVAERRLMTNDDWTPRAERQTRRQEKAPTLGEYAPRWLAVRKVKGQPSRTVTRDHLPGLDPT